MPQSNLSYLNFKKNLVSVVSSFGGLAVLSFGVIRAISQGLAPALVSIISGTFLLSNFILLKKDILTLNNSIKVLTIVYFILPIPSFIFDGGLSGIIPYAIISIQILLQAITKSSNQMKIVLTLSFEALALGLLHIFFPEAILNGEMDETKKIIITTCVFAILIGCGLIIKSLVQLFENYNSQLKTSTELLSAHKTDLELNNLKLKESNEKLEEFGYIVSHDLKTPIRGINNLATFIKEDLNTESTDVILEHLDGIKKLTTKSTTLIDDIFYYSKLSSINLSQSTFSLHEICEEIFQEFKVIHKEAVHLSLNQLPKINADKSRLKEVLHNFISNAIKYNNSEIKKVDLSYDKQTASLTIKDNGIGIAEEDYSKVFGMFQRLNSNKEFPNGTGAGLAITKKILDRHFINVRINSKLREGSSFILDLKNVVVK